jgi:hypothetical protein
MNTKVNNKSVKVLGVEPNEQGCIFEFNKQVEFGGHKSKKVFAGWDLIVGTLFAAAEPSKPKKAKSNEKKK